MPPAAMVMNVKPAQLDSSLVTLFVSPVHSINMLLGMNALCVARAALSVKLVQEIVSNAQKTLSFRLVNALAVIHSFSTKIARFALRAKPHVLHAIIQVLARPVLLDLLLETPNACSVLQMNSFKEMLV